MAAALVAGAAERDRLRERLRAAEEIVAERAAMTAQMMELDRMVAVGTLAAGVGHEINNPLAYILSNVDFIRRQLTLLETGEGVLPPAALATAAVAAAGNDAGEREIVDLAELGVALDETLEGALRVRDIVANLRAFARSDVEARGPVRLERILDAAVRLVHGEVKHRARLTARIAPLPPVFGSDSKLAQLFLNLLLNAAQAIPDGRAADHEIAVTAGVADGIIVVTVRDTGQGIPADQIARVFDPFFTTKPVGRGTGLGLYVCRTTVEAHGGRIAIAASAPGAGTTVRVELPAMSAAAAAEGSAAAALVVSAPRRARILVIDDEPMIGRTMRRALASDHDVLAVTSVREALDLLGRESFDLIFCDLPLPGPPGVDFHAELARLAPAQLARLVYLTGGACNAETEALLCRFASRRLDKPFATADLHALVRDALR